MVFGGAGDSFVRVTTRVNRHLRCAFGFVTRHSRYTFGLEDKVGSTFEVCLILFVFVVSSFVAFVRFEVPFPRSAFEATFPG